MRLITTIGILVIITASNLVSFAAPPSEVRTQVDQLCRQGRFVEATSLAMGNLIASRTKNGPSSYITAEYTALVAEVARHRGKYYLAQKLYDRAIAIQANASTNDPDLLMAASSATLSDKADVVSLRNRVNELCACGETTAAVHCSMGALLKSTKEYGRNHPNTAGYLSVVGDVAKARGKYYLSSLLYREALTVLQDAPSTKKLVQND
jgi:tetratricopeptide (TPR) repeat protein